MPPAAAAPFARPAHRGCGRALPTTQAGACRPAVPAAARKRARRWRMAGARGRPSAGGMKRHRPCFGGRRKALVAKSVAGWGVRRPRAECSRRRLVDWAGSKEGFKRKERKGPQTGAKAACRFGIPALSRAAAQAARSGRRRRPAIPLGQFAPVCGPLRFDPSSAGRASTGFAIGAKRNEHPGCPSSSCAATKPSSPSGSMIASRPPATPTDPGALRSSGVGVGSSAEVNQGPATTCAAPERSGFRACSGRARLQQPQCRAGRSLGLTLPLRHRGFVHARKPCEHRLAHPGRSPDPPHVRAAMVGRRRRQAGSVHVAPPRLINVCRCAVRARASRTQQCTSAQST